MSQQPSPSVGIFQFFASPKTSTSLDAYKRICNINSIKYLSQWAKTWNIWSPAPTKDGVKNDNSHPVDDKSYLPCTTQGRVEGASEARVDGRRIFLSTLPENISLLRTHNSPQVIKEWLVLVLISRDERECTLFVYLLVDVSFFFFCLLCLFRSNLRCRDYEHLARKFDWQW